MRNGRNLNLKNLKNQPRMKRDPKKGASMVEFAVIFPLLLMMTLGTVDFGRIFHHAVVVTSAASAGALYGSQNNLYSSDNEGMDDAASQDAATINGEVTASSDRFCDCPDSPASGPEDSENVVDCLTGVCVNDGYGIPRLFVRSHVLMNFQTLGPYPGVPSSTAVGRNGFMRVQ